MNIKEITNITFNNEEETEIKVDFISSVLDETGQTIDAPYASVMRYPVETWHVKFVQEWIDAGNNIAPYVEPQWETDRKDRDAIRRILKRRPKLRALLLRRPQDLQTHLDNYITNQAKAKEIIILLALGLSLVAREELSSDD